MTAGADGSASTASTTGIRIPRPQAGRGMPGFDLAIIGNSTAQLLNPADLSQSTGLRFVQLYLTGGSPREQLAVLDFFLRHHPRVGALVFVTDPFWCAHRRAETRPGDFPYWLYGTGTLSWAARLMSRDFHRACIPAHLDRSRSAPAQSAGWLFQLRGHLAARPIPRDQPAERSCTCRRRSGPQFLSRNNGARRRNQKAAGRCCRRRGRSADSRLHRR